MRSRVSYRFQIDSAYMCERAKTMRKCYEWTRMFLETEKKSCVNFQTNTDTCGQALTVACNATPSALGTGDACYFLETILSFF